MIENSQVFVTIFRTSAIGKIRIASSCAPRANPISHAVSGQRVIIPTDIGSICRGALELISFIVAQSTIASAIRRQAAFIDTNATLGTHFTFRRMKGKVKQAPSLFMSFLYARQYGSKVPPNTIETHP
ncbi:unnamed protein product [marine sediment metagenome]|uniref:Uncharacterized protein n=1 Tax=marine sediment metagenome TaxID=412755 RepID=X1JZU3_9ZZZZ